MRIILGGKYSALLDPRVLNRCDSERLEILFLGIVLALQSLAFVVVHMSISDINNFLGCIQFLPLNLILQERIEEHGESLRVIDQFLRKSCCMRREYLLDFWSDVTAFPPLHPYPGIVQFQRKHEVQKKFDRGEVKQVIRVHDG